MLFNFYVYICNNMNIYEYKLRATLTTTALAHALEGELTRHIGKFKQENKKCYNELVKVTESIVNFSNSELDEDSKKAVDELQGYICDLISDLHENKCNELSLTVGLCESIHDCYFSHLSKDKFLNKFQFELLANQCKLFTKLNQNSYNALKFQQFFKKFMQTLILNEEFTFDKKYLY